MYKNFHLRIYRFSQFPDNINNENLSIAILSLTSWSAWSNDKGLSWLPADPLKWKFFEFQKQMTCSPQQQDIVVAHLTVTEVKLVFSHIACSPEAIWEDRGK